MFRSHRGIDKAIEYNDRTGLCPVCRERPSTYGITCGDMSCISGWLKGYEDPCIGLISYGIQNYECDVVAQVCYITQELYVYQLSDGIRAIQSGRYKKIPGFQMVDGTRTKTAGGYIVPSEDLLAIGIDIPNDIYSKHSIYKSMSTSKKGELAQRIVRDCLSLGIFPNPIDSQVVKDLDSQYRGNDLVVSQKVGKIQVKCDGYCGRKSRGGSGSLFLQVCEINPNKSY